MSEPAPSDLDREVQKELLLTVRAERRLCEHELTRRRVLLVLTVVLPLAGIVLAALGHPFVGSAFAGSGFASGVVALPRGGGRR